MSDKPTPKPRRRTAFIIGGVVLVGVVSLVVLNWNALLDAYYGTYMTSKIIRKELGHPATRSKVDGKLIEEYQVGKERVRVEYWKNPDPPEGAPYLYFGDDLEQLVELESVSRFKSRQRISDALKEAGILLRSAQGSAGLHEEYDIGTETVQIRYWWQNQ